jgi:hypothetical protein
MRSVSDILQLLPFVEGFGGVRPGPFSEVGTVREY